MQRLGVSLILVSFIPWLLVLGVPLLPISLPQKAILVPILMVVAEALFWVGLLLVGKEAATRYRQWLNPRVWWQQIQTHLRTRHRR